MSKLTVSVETGQVQVQYAKTTRLGNRGRQLGEAEDKTHVHGRQKKRGDGKTEGTGRRPAECPAKVLA